MKDYGKYIKPRYSTTGQGWTRAERKFQIARVMLYDAFANEQDVFVQRWYTLREIGKMIGLRPTSYLTSLLEDLRDEDAIIIREGEAPNGHMRFEYAILATVLDTDKYHEPFAKYFRELGW